MITQHTAKIYPSGDFSVAARPRMRSPKPDKSAKSDRSATPPEISPMGLSDATISQNTSKPLVKRTRKGQLGINPHGKRMLRSSTAVLSKLFPRSLTTFCTVTTPTISKDENWIINANWSELVRQLIQWISNQQVKNAIDPNISYCIEVQEKRYKETGIVGLHLHIVFQGRKSLKHGYIITPKSLDTEYKRLVEKLLNRSVDVSASNKLETPRGNLAKEIGKYLSKGGTHLCQANDKDLLPTAWWGMTKTLKAKVLSAIIKFTGEDATYFWDNIADLPIKYWLVRLSAAYGNYPVAKVGWITDKSYLATMYNIYNYT